MSGSMYGTHFSIATWGESHGPGIGVVIDGCPAGLPLSEEDIQLFLDRRKPGQTRYATPRKESDTVEILSGVFEGRTTGTPISLLVRNTNQHSKDYGNLKDCYRPGHADYTFDAKYGFRDYRGGGRSSGRETIGRVAAGAVAAKILTELGIHIQAYTKAIGPCSIPEASYHMEEIAQNPFHMPNNEMAKQAEEYLDACMQHQDSAGGIIECRITGCPAGLGEPVFDKLDARLAQAVLSIGAVKGIEFGDGFAAAQKSGSTNNDAFRISESGTVAKLTNHAGGILGGISDGSTILFRAAIKPTPSIAQQQNTVTAAHEETSITIHGRHDPIIVPRAVVVVEAMAAITIVDLLFSNLSSRMEYLKKIYFLPDHTEK
ncbi:MAG TPA: chorismate synthase [Lachnospiraceae bacterium]|nr:chorismate synthase [Lachnospiraceae bacterium]